MCNMKALSLLVRKLWPGIKFFRSRSSFKVNSRFDGPIHPMADLEMFFPMNFFDDSCPGVILERF